MQTSAISIIESLKGKLLGYPALVDSLNNKDINFLDSLDKWIKEAETILKNNNIAQCSELAGYRSKIIAPLFSESHRRSSRKLQLQIASGLMYDIQNTVLSVLQPYELRVNEARELLINLLTIVKQTRAIIYTADTDFQSFINQIWKLFITHEQLKPSSIKILTLVSQIDALRILAEEIDLQDWE